MYLLKRLWLFIFLDESGDLGFDFENSNSSTHFCITLLVCNYQKTLFSLRSVVKNTLVRKLNYHKTKKVKTELKGTNTNLEIKKYFYQQLENFTTPVLQDLKIYTITFDKRKLLHFLNTDQNQHKLYNLVAKEILDAVDFSNVSDQVILYVDCCKGSKERKIFDAYIRAHLEIKLPLDVSLDIMHEQSHHLAGLQVVDLFCYGIVRKYAMNDKSWFDIFSSRIRKEIFWQPNF